MRIAVIDLGTNSVRFDVHQIGPGDRIRQARLVLFNPAYHGDPVLDRIMDGYAAEVAENLVGLVRRLHMEEREFDLVLSGSQLTKGRHPALNNGIIDRLRAQFPGCEPVLVDGDPVEGALRIAAELAGQAGPATPGKPPH